MLEEFFAELADMTGWIFMALMGGPHPELGGEIDVAR